MPQKICPKVNRITTLTSALSFLRYQFFNEDYFEDLGTIFAEFFVAKSNYIVDKIVASILSEKLISLQLLVHEVSQVLDKWEAFISNLGNTEIV